MSNFLGFDSYLIPLGASIQNTQNEIETAFTSRAWQVVAKSIPATSIIGAWTNVGNAFDGDVTTTAYTSSALPQSLGVQVAGGFTPTRIIIHGDTGNTTYNPNAFSLDFSDDGTTWTTLQSWTGETAWSLYEQRNYTVVGAASHAYWRLTVTANNGGGTTAIANLTFQDSNNQQVFNGIYRLDLIPPATETIGGSGAFEFVRFRFAPTTIGIIPMKKWTKSFPQEVYIYQQTAGAVTCSVTLNGQTVSYTGASGNSAVDNLNGLYGAIRDSVNAEFTGWTWNMSLPAPQNADDGNTYIFGLSNTIQNNKTITGTNVVAGVLSNAVRSGWTQPEALAVSQIQVTIDLVNGFIYYLQINARGFALGTKTNSSYFGPIHGCWADNASAVAYMPTDNQFITARDLVVGYDNANTAEDSVAYTATGWGIIPKSNAVQTPYGNFSMGTPAWGVRRHRFTEVMMNAYTAGYGPTNAFSLYGSGMFSGNQILGNDFQIHRMKTLGASAWDIGGNMMAPWISELAVRPGYEIEDWYKFRGTANNEALSLVADTVSTTGLSSNYTPGDTVVNLVDASTFQTSGFAIIGADAIKYTGKTGNQLTGVTGGQYATVSTRHFTGDQVSQGLWFVIINGGALLAGYNKPV